MHVHRPADRGPTVPRVALAGLFLPLAIFGALVLSASATVDLFRSQGVSDRIVWAAVLMVEVTVLSGTLLWLLVRSTSLRRDARLVTFGATAVTLVAGWHAYGPVGLTAGVGAVAVTHLASRAWREPWNAEATDEPAREPRTVADAVAQLDTSTTADDSKDAPAQETAPPLTPEVTATPDGADTDRTGDSEPVDDSPDTPTAHVVSMRWPDPPRTWKHGVSTWRKALTDARAGMGRPRLMKKYGFKTAAGVHVLDAVKREREQAA